jgi:hypothetical protein
MRFDDPMPRWCFVDGSDYYLRLVVSRMGARVMIDTTGGLPACEESTNGFIDYCVPSASPYVVIAPDTARMRDRIADLLAGRLDRFLDRSPAPPKVQWFKGPPSYGAPGEFLRFPVVSAECSVSGLLREGQWGDAAGLEAARILLLKRFDLKLGLWDLALNPVLRSTVLDALPVQDVPGEAVQIPAFAWKHAERRNEKAKVRPNTAQRARRDTSATLQQVLAPIGWRGTLDRFSLPLTEPLGDTADPLVELEIRVNKSSTHVVVSHQFYEEIDIRAFIEKRREAFEAVGLPPASTKRRASARYPLSATLWTANVGWGDADADWSNIAKAIADRTKQWVGLLADFVASCREIRHAKYGGSQSYRERPWRMPGIE